MLAPSTSERMFALIWWRGLSNYSKEELSKKHFPHYPLVAVDKSTSNIVKIYQQENK